MKKIIYFMAIIHLLYYASASCMPRGKSKELKRIDDHQRREMAQSRIRDLSLYWFEENERMILQKQWAQQEHNQNMRPMCDGRSAHRIRITLNSTCVKNLEKVTNDLIAGVRSQRQNAQSSQKWIDDHKKKEMVHSCNQLYFYWYCGQRKAKILEKKPLTYANCLINHNYHCQQRVKKKDINFNNPIFITKSNVHSKNVCTIKRIKNCRYRKKECKSRIEQKDNFQES
jgi:hypothetical protein